MRRLFVLIILALVLLPINGLTLAQDGPPASDVMGDHTGYTLFTPQASNRVYLVDSQGRIVHDWTVSGNGRDAILRDNGNLVVSVAQQDTAIAPFAADVRFIAIDGRIEEYTWDGELVWAYELDRPGYQVHHGIKVLPNGNVMFIAWEYKSTEEAIAAGRDPDQLGDGLWPDTILEYSPEQDAIVWEWHTWDHLIQDFDPDQANFGVVADHPERANVNFAEPAESIEDWQHANAIDYNPQLDQVVFSVREFNEFWIIDHSTTTEEARGEAGDLLYRWGNPRAYDRGDITNRHISYQHDVRWVPEGYPGAGNITLYSNRNSTDPNATVAEIAENAEYSRVVEVALPRLDDGTYALEDGQPYGPAEPTWVYDGRPDHPFFSNFISGAERLSNGNTLITEGAAGHLFEVTPEGQIVWDYLPPFHDIAILTPEAPATERQIMIFRARRYEPDYPAFDGRDLSNAVAARDLATTDVSYPGYLDKDIVYETTLSSETPARYYAAYLWSDQTLRNSFTVEVLDGNIDPVVSVTNRQLEPYVEDASSGGDRTARIEDFVPATNQWVYVVIRHAGDDMTGIEGRVRVTFEVSDLFADVDPEIPRIQYGTSVQDMISNDDPESLFAFYGGEGQTVTVRMQRDNENLDPVVELLDANGEVLISATAEQTTPPVATIDSYALPASGVYFIRTTRAGDTTGVYTVELSQTNVN